MRSPIKSILRNKTKGSFTVPLSNQFNPSFSPVGTQFDTVTIDGDIFSRLGNNGAAADRLMSLIVDDTLELTYTVDSFFSNVIPNTGDSFYDNNSALARKLAERSCTVVEEAPVEEEPTVIISGPNASIIEEKVEEKEVEVKEPEKAVEDKVEEPVVEEAKAEQPVEEPVKTRKRAKKIKVD